MDPGLFLLSKDEMKARFADKGSPDYQTHPHGCPCSGCYASWVEWRGGHAAVEAAAPAVAVLRARVEALEVAMRDLDDDDQIGCLGEASCSRHAPCVTCRARVTLGPPPAGVRR